MKVARKHANGQSREMLLKEYFLNAYLIALLKKAGQQSARVAGLAGGGKPAKARAARA